MKHIFFFLLINISIIFQISTSFGHAGAKGIIKERMDKFQESKSIMRKINKSFGNSDFKTIEQGASILFKWGSEMNRFFPDGSNTKPSEAREEIWLEPEVFKIAIENFTKASSNLLMISQKKDLEKTIQAFREVADTCKGCHKKFRN